MIFGKKKVWRLCKFTDEIFYDTVINRIRVQWENVIVNVKFQVRSCPAHIVFYSIFGVIAIAGLLSGCGGYNVRILKPLNKDTAHFKGKNNGVKLYVARLDKKEQRAALGRSVPQDKIVTLQLTVRNTSPFSVVISHKHISLPTLPVQEVIRATEYSVMGPLLAGIGAAVVADAATAGTHDKGARLAGALAGTTVLAGGTAAAVTNASENDDFAVAVTDKVLKEETLWPGEEVTKLLFVARQAFHLPFSIRVSQLVENVKGKVVEKHVLPFKIKFFDELA